MSDNNSSPVLKLGSYVSVTLGPVLSKTIPMASDLRPWAFWFSGIVSAATLLYMLVRMSGVTNKEIALRDFRICCVAVVVFAFAHVAINLVWTVETGDSRDILWQLGIIGTFGLGVGSITGALVAWDKVAKTT